MNSKASKASVFTVTVKKNMEPLHIDFAKSWLKDPRINPNKKDRYGDTALHRAVQYNQLSIVKLLLADPRIKPNIKDYNDDTPLHIAAYQGNENIIELLLADPRVDPNARDSNGRTVLHIAVLYSRTLSFTDPRLDPNIQDIYGETALHLAIELSRLEQIRQLRSHPKIDSGTYLKRRKLSEKIVALFLECGAYSPPDLEVIKTRFPELWEQHCTRFKKTFEALNQGPLAKQVSILSLLVAENLYPGVPFFYE